VLVGNESNRILAPMKRFLYWLRQDRQGRK